MHDYRIHSQNGEDGIIAWIFEKIGHRNRCFVEFGVGNGTVCNTRLLLERGWNGLWMDSAPSANERIKVERVEPDNVEALFDRYKVPHEFDLLSIDIDGMDYYVWHALRRWHPRVVVIEYNARLGPRDDIVVPYDKEWSWDQTDYFGASLAALNRLAESKGYGLVACDHRGVNAFFVDQSEPIPFVSVKKGFRRVRYGRIGLLGRRGHPRSPRWDTLKLT